MVIVRNNTNKQLQFSFEIKNKISKFEIPSKSEKNVPIAYYPIIKLVIEDNNKIIWKGPIPFSSKPIIYDGINLSIGNLNPPSVLDSPSVSKSRGRLLLFLILLIIIVVIAYYFFYKK